MGLKLKVLLRSSVVKSSNNQKRLLQRSDRQLAEAARDESNGHIVTDEEILNAYRKIAAQDGVFIEPGSAASLAGVIQHVKAGKIKPGETVVAVFTGNGLKDPDTAIKATEVTINKMSDLEKCVSIFVKELPIYEDPRS